MILDLSKAEAGKLELEEEEFGIDEAIEIGSKMVEILAHRKNVELASEHPRIVPVIRADKRKIVQVLINLLSNAIKYGGDKQTVTIAADTLANGMARIRVIDQGVGIPVSDLDRVFLPFEQGGDVFTKRVQGTGLGLPLSRRLMELHDGELTLASAPGKGTIATMTIPAERVVRSAG